MKLIGNNTMQEMGRKIGCGKVEEGPDLERFVGIVRLRRREGAEIGHREEKLQMDLGNAAGRQEGDGFVTDEWGA